MWVVSYYHYSAIQGILCSDHTTHLRERATVHRTATSSIANQRDYTVHDLLHYGTCFIPMWQVSYYNYAAIHIISECVNTSHYRERPTVYRTATSNIANQRDYTVDDLFHDGTSFIPFWKVYPVRSEYVFYSLGFVCCFQARV